MAIGTSAGTSGSQGREATRIGAVEQLQTGSKPAPDTYAFWTFYFLLTIALVGGVFCYLITFACKALALLFPPLSHVGDRALRVGIGFLMAIQPWLHATVDLRVTFKNCLMVSNHRSTLDVFLLLASVSGIQLVAKRTLYRIPFLGLAMRVMKNIPIGEGGEDYRKAMEVVRDRLRSGERVHVFPEMTRCDPGFQGVRRFRATPFLVAFQEKIPVVPIAFAGTDRAWPKGSFGLSFRQPVRAQALSPLFPNDFASAKEMQDRAWHMIESFVLEHS